MKITIALVTVVIIFGGLYLYTVDKSPTPSALLDAPMTENSTAVANESEVKTTVAPGVYIVVPAQSTVNWAGKKPLLSGYINQGSIALKSGSISVTDTTAQGSFIIDMNTLSVTQTPTKPGQESRLAEHLMGERWFNVSAHPTATFTINEVTKLPDSDETFVYMINGSLTMKGKTNPLSFPATIYTDANNNLKATASLEFNRTLWDITSGSASFFDGLADNVIDDMVSLSFDLTATPQ